MEGWVRLAGAGASGLVAPFPAPLGCVGGSGPWAGASARRRPGIRPWTGARSWFSETEPKRRAYDAPAHGPSRRWASAGTSWLVVSGAAGFSGARGCIDVRLRRVGASNHNGAAPENEPTRPTAGGNPLNPRRDTHYP
ncbi:hypothetical protein GCM10023080_069680 [Streptomyces pseudoechinosporeus]